MAAAFATEADLCRQFIAAVERANERRKARFGEDVQVWTPYPETAGFDILFVANDGRQIGVEAKLRLNGKVLAQALPSYITYSFGMIGPDYRAVLVPSSGDLQPVCSALGLTVLTLRDDRYGIDGYTPSFPVADRDDSAWHDWCPQQRCTVPEVNSDTVAGVPSPIQLTEWKIKAIKLAIILEQRPVSRADFKALNLSPSRWTAPFTGWLVKSNAGYVPGPHMPDFRRQHPVAYEQLKERFSIPTAVPRQLPLLDRGLA